MLTIDYFLANIAWDIRIKPEANNILVYDENSNVVTLNNSKLYECLDLQFNSIPTSFKFDVIPYSLQYEVKCRFSTNPTIRKVLYAIYNTYQTLLPSDLSTQLLNYCRKDERTYYEIITKLSNGDSIKFIDFVSNYNIPYTRFYDLDYLSSTQWTISLTLLNL